MVDAVFELGGVARRYDWGSVQEIPRLLGTVPDGRPVAELWFGAHHGDPSPALGTTLDALVTADPGALLGADVLREHGPHLPFLLKVLAAARPLSIQVHPTREQALAGYAREDAAGVPLDAPQRNYVDRNHKPEMLCALTPFEALCGFRPVAGTLELLRDARIPQLAFVADLLAGTDGLRAAFTALLRHPDPVGLAGAVAARATPDGPLRPAWLAAQHFPGDIGIAVSVLLNHVRLGPGEAIYLGAGNVHAYLHGMGVEVMASSDNVLRCGLTPKHMDVEAVLGIADFSPLTEPRWAGADGRFAVPVADFALRAFDGAAPTTVDGPAIVLVTGGAVEVGEVPVQQGSAAYVCPRTPVPVRGPGQAFLATAG